MALLALAASAQATSVSFHVVNGAGVDQAAVDVHADASVGPGLDQTDYAGQVTVSAPAGTTLYFSRGRTQPSACQPPEGSGQTYTVPAADPAGAQTITLPSSTYRTDQPSISKPERKMVGEINQLRTAAGLAPLRISLTLSAAADGYATYFVDHPTSDFVDEPCLFSNPGARAIDAGWPIEPEITELSSFRYIAYESEPSKSQVMDPSLGVIGVAQALPPSGTGDDAWVLDLAPAPDPSVPGYARAQITDDLGDPNAGDGGGGIHEIDGGQKPHLRLVKFRHRRLRFRLRLTIEPEAMGRLRGVMYWIPGDGTYQIKRFTHIHRHGSRILARGKVTKPGKWQVGLVFSGKRGWGDQSAAGRPTNFGRARAPTSAVTRPTRDR